MASELLPPPRARGPRPVVVTRELRCSGSAEQLWPTLTDTERLNRALGLGALELEPHSDASAARYVVRTVSGGLPLVYEERPFEWVLHERFGVRRVVRRGALTEIDHQFYLRPLPEGGTLVGVRVAATPRVGLLGPVVRITVARFLDRLVAAVHDADLRIASGAEARVSTTVRPPPRAALDRVAAELTAQVAPSASQSQAALRLIELVAGGEDIDVDRIRPFELAQRWQQDRTDVLATCLHAVGAGLLELSWDLVCPSCRTAAESASTLSSIQPGGHCQLCDLAFDVDLDRAVEATFRPSRAVREVDAGPYCIGGPARTPHVVVQRVLAAGEHAELPVPATGRLRLFARGGALASVDADAGAPATATVVLADDRFEPPDVRVAPGGTLRVLQRDGKERHVKLERLEWASQAATAHHLLTLPEFRARFASEVLRPGLTLHVARVALLFTDLTNSTALYAEVGDARAFGVVQEHFEVLREVLARHGGTLVKTIGDAVMAAFLDEEGAVRAAVDMHRAFPALRAKNATARANRLKIGLFAGPCYVVTANGVLDYFGQTVNVAARLQGAAEGGEIVLTEQTAVLAEAQGWLDGSPITQHFSAVLKGLPAPVPAVRVLVDHG